MCLHITFTVSLSRPMQRKLVTLLNCQLLEAEGRARAVRAARSLGERSVTELLLAHQVIIVMMIVMMMMMMVMMMMMM